MVTRHSNVDAAAALPLSRTDVLYPMAYETRVEALLGRSHVNTDALTER